MAGEVRHTVARFFKLWLGTPRFSEARIGRLSEACYGRASSVTGGWERQDR